MPGSPDDGPQIGYGVLPRGTPVFTSDGAELGRVHRVLDNEREHIFDGIVVRAQGGLVFVDAPEVARIAERRVTLTIDATAAAELPPPRGRRAVAGGRPWWMDRFKRTFGSR